MPHTRSSAATTRHVLPPSPVVRAVAAALTTLAVPLLAQCEPHWLAGEPRTVPVGDVRASTYWDPDGAGPAPLRVVHAGSLAAATAPHTALASFDGAQWDAFGGVAGTGTAVCTHNGQLHAAVRTTTVVGGFPFSHTTIQAWNGTSWSPLGTTVGEVNVLASHGGRLVAAGSFSALDTATAASIAAWDGVAWAPLGSGVGGTVRALATLGNALWVGGSLASAGGAPVGNLAIWTGSAWTGGATFNGSVDALIVRSAIAVAQTSVYAGGAFTSFTVGATTTPAARVARFDGINQTWTTVGGGLPGARCTTLAFRNIGLTGFEVAAAVADPSSTQLVWRLASGVWSPLGSFTDTPGTVWPASLVYFGGRWTAGAAGASSATAPGGAVRAFDGSTWPGLTGLGIGGTVHAVAPAGDDLVIGGRFTAISGATVNGIARGGPGAWTALGGGVSGGQGVFGVAVAANGDVLATGDFTHAGGVPCNHVARWNGVAWAPLGSGLNGTGHALIVQPNGDVVAAGAFTSAGGGACNRVARWNGAVWTPLGSGASAQVNALVRLADGSLVAGGNFTSAGGVACSRIARWHNGAWAPLGSGCNGPVLALAAAPSGDLFAAGSFTSAGGVATRIGKWNGSAWSGLISLGITSDVHALAVHPGGDLFVGGGVFSFSLGPFGGWTSNLVRITAGGTLSPASVQGTAVFAATIASDDLVIAGAFATAAGTVTANVARLHAPCPATAVSFGSGCAGLGGPLTLTATAAPWLGGAWRLLAASAFALRAVGFAPLPGPVPLGAFLAGALPGCVGLVPADLAEVHLPVQGAVELVTPVPDATALLGAQLHEQVLQFEAAGGGALAISSSNAVTVTVGGF